MKSNKPKPLWHGIVLVAGGAIGAGMFALPIASAGAWMLWSVVGFFVVWLATYISASLFANVHLSLVQHASFKVTPLSSFSSIVRECLGTRWEWANNISIVFILMILVYAYTTAGAGIIQSSASLIFQLEENTVWFKGWLSLGFATLIAFIVWLGTSAVSRFILLLIVLMAGLFALSMLNLAPSIEMATLSYPVNQAHYLFAALPVYVTAFACGGLVPSLVGHYSGSPKTIKASIFWGTLATLSIYLLWLAITLGNIPREAFIEITNNGGSISELVDAFVERGVSPALKTKLVLFSHCAVVTSFLSIGLSLVHFIQDKLGLTKHLKHKLVAVIIGFAPPAVASFFAPYGFVHAIGFAGAFVAFSFFIVPGVSARRLVTQFDTQHLHITSVVSMAAGIIILSLKILAILAWLPVFDAP